LLDGRHDEGSSGVCDRIKVGIAQKLCAGMKNWNRKEESWIRKDLRLAFRKSRGRKRGGKRWTIYTGRWRFTFSLIDSMNSQ
jgi:hypothetical protein